MTPNSRADWDAGVARWGDAMIPGCWNAPIAQRRFDALLAIFTAAAASGAAGEFDPLVNIIVDQTTLEHHLAKLAGGERRTVRPDDR